ELLKYIIKEQGDIARMIQLPLFFAVEEVHPPLHPIGVDMNRCKAPGSRTNEALFIAVSIAAAIEKPILAQKERHIKRCCQRRIVDRMINDMVAGLALP